MILTCDRCGEPHGPASRFCRTCGRDFSASAGSPVGEDRRPAAAPTIRYRPSGAIAAGPQAGTAVPPAAVAAAAASTAPPSTRRTPLLVGGAALVLAIVVGLGWIVTRSGQGIVAAADLPPSGTAWFGASFDPQTFVLSGRTSTVRLGQPIAVVGHLTRPSRDETLGFAIDLAGVQLSEPGERVSAGHDLVGVSIPGVEVFEAGTLTVRIIDASGTTLAWGAITVSP